jgi:hypothetical protein
LNNHGLYGCLLTWRDSFVLLGGNSNVKTIEIFNQSWRKVDSSNIPMSIAGSGCVVLPNEEILVVGSAAPGFKNSTALYNVEDNTWIDLGETSSGRSYTSLVRLGDRTFAVGGDVPDLVEEFVYSDKSWVAVEAELQVPRRVHSSLAVPADLFAHLPGGCQGV